MSTNENTMPSDAAIPPKYNTLSPDTNMSANRDNPSPDTKMSSDDSNASSNTIFVTPMRMDEGSWLVRIHGNLVTPVVDGPDLLLPELIDRMLEAEDDLAKANYRAARTKEQVMSALEAMPRQGSRHQSMHWLDGVVFPILDKCSKEYHHNDIEDNIGEQVCKLQEKIEALWHQSKVTQNGSLIRAVERQLDEMERMMNRGELMVDTDEWKAYDLGTAAQAILHLRQSRTKLDEYKQRLVAKAVSITDEVVAYDSDDEGENDGDTPLEVLGGKY